MATCISCGKEAVQRVAIAMVRRFSDSEVMVGMMTVALCEACQEELPNTGMQAEIVPT